MSLLERIAPNPDKWSGEFVTPPTVGSDFIFVTPSGDPTIFTTTVVNVQVLVDVVFFKTKSGSTYRLS